MGEQLERSDRRLAEDPIAIVGLSGLFPKARDHREYWQNIVDAVDCTEEVPASRWKIDDHYDPDPGAADKTYSRRGAFIPDVEFDPLEFGLPPNQLEVTSTMQTLSLGVARDLLRDCGADGDWYDPRRTGVVLGVTGPVPLMHPLAARLSTPVLKEVVRSCGLSEQDADAIADKYVSSFAPWEENSYPGLLANVVAGRVANRLGLGGLNCTVDAACAASLSAMRTAIAELVDGRADTMITGGVDTETTIFTYLCFSKVGALSRRDRISPFDDAADGTLLGEGIGMLALRRLADAERDGNRIYAVIRGIGSSSDGRAKSIYAPHAQGQRLALERAYADADCSAATVELFEAHATGTAVGDRTELTALGELLRDSAGARHGAALGSVKSQIGHTRGAAGAASVLKLALSLYHRVLPPTINVERPSQAVDFADSPFYLNIRTRPWVRDPHRPRRRAAASAMGFGGTNFHIVLEEHDHGPILHRTPRAHLWHAPDTAALLDLLRSGAAPTDAEVIPADHARIGFVATDDEAELRKLAASQLAARADAAEWSHPRGVFFRRAGLPELKVGALFAGQGSQYLDMGLKAVLNTPTIADTLDEANAFFDDAGPRLAQVMFPPPVFDAAQRQAQKDLLRGTEYAQPAIGALAAGQFRFLRGLGLRCAGYLGHSFGEVTALWAAGSVSDADFFRLARARGQAMMPVSTEADPGAMVAVNASREQVEEILAGIGDVEICNHNAPDQVVVGGGTAAVETVIQVCVGRGVAARRLPVAAAFHTHYVGHAVEAFRPAVESVHIGAPGAPVHTNSPGASYGADTEANRRVLLAQLRQPVEFVAALRTMREAGCTVFVEFGPKQVLTSVARRTLGDTAVVIPTDSGPHGDSDAALKQAALRLAVLGAPIARINRFQSAEPEVPQARGHTVTLSAPEYVPEERRNSYQEALNGGHRMAKPEPPAAQAPAPAPAKPKPKPDSVLQQHLAVHTEYLQGQLRVAEQLVAAIGQGTVDSALAEAVVAVKDQSVAIGKAHTKANEILAALAGIELGATVPEPAAEVPLPEPVDTWAPAPAAVPEPVLPAPPPVNSAPVDPAPAAPVVAAPPPAPPPVAAAPAGDVRSVLLEVVAERTGYPVEMLDPGMDLEADLGVDSIRRVQVLAAVQQRLPGLPRVGPDLLGELRTLDQIVGYLDGRGDADPKALDAGAKASRHRVELTELAPMDLLAEPYRADPVAVVLGTDELGIAGALEYRGWTVRRTFDGDPVDLCLVLLAENTENAENADNTENADWAAISSLTETIMTAGQAIGPLTAVTGTRAAFVTVTRLDGELGWRGRRTAGEALLGGVGGIVKTLAIEEPALFCRAIDLDPALPSRESADALLAELYDAATDTLEVGVAADGRRCTVVPSRHAGAKEISQVDPAAAFDGTGLDTDELLVVSGGARGVTALCVRELAERSSAEFILLGRTELTDEPEWARGVADHDLRRAAMVALERPAPREVERECRNIVAQREIRATMAALGTRASYHAADVTDSDAVRAALGDRRDRVTGFVHGAGVLADAMLPDVTAEQCDRVFAVKLAGARTVLAVLKDAPLRHLVFFTSVVGLLGNAAQAAYAAANEALCRVAASWRAGHPGMHVTAVDWSAWHGGMVAPELGELLTARGVPLLEPAAGARAFAEQFTAERAAETCVLVGADIALSELRRPPRPAFTAYRSLAPLAGDPFGPAQVAFGLGWLVNVLERAHSGLQVVEVRDYQVRDGTVFDGDPPGEPRVEARAGSCEGERIVVTAAVRSTSHRGLPTTHYTGTFVLAPGPPRAPGDRGEGDLVVECRLSEQSVAGGAFGGRLYHPVLADLLFQKTSLLHEDLVGVPREIGRAEFFARLPDDQPFLLVLEKVAAGADSVTVNVTANDGAGRVLQRLTAVTAAPAPERGASG